MKKSDERSRIERLEREIEVIKSHLLIQIPLSNNEEIKPLKDWVVPLAHETLTREEVAERCVKAAQLKGYKRDKTHYWGEYIEGKLFFWANDRGDGCGFYTHDCQVEQSIEITTLEAFEAYCGVESKPETYEAGFNFMGGITSLNVPDNSSILFNNNNWSKGVRFSPQPHTLTPVKIPTKGRFYLIKGRDPNHFSSYALCLEEHSIRAVEKNGVVLVELVDEDDISNFEVTPINE